MSDETFTCFSLGDLKRIAKYYNKEFIDNKQDKIQYSKRSKAELWQQLFEKTRNNEDYYFPLERERIFKGRYNRITNDDITFIFTHLERMIGVEKFKFYGVFHHQEIQNIIQSFVLSNSDHTVIIVRDFKKPTLLTVLSIQKVSKKISFFDPRGYQPSGQMKRLMKTISSSHAKNFKEKISTIKIQKSSEFNIEVIKYLLRNYIG